MDRIASPRSRRELLAGGAALCASTVAGCLGGRGAEETVTRTIDPGGAEALSTGPGIGDVTVRGEDREDVHVEATIRAASQESLEEADLVVERGERITLASNGEGGGGGWILTPPEPLIDLDVTAPASFHLDSIDVGSGTVDAAGVAGPSTIDTGSGRIDTRRVDGDLIADSGSGDQSIEAIDGSVIASASSGEITVRDVRGDTRTDTGSGNQRIVDVDGGVDASSGSGAVDVDLSTLGGNVLVDTGSGDVSVSLPESADASISVSTGSGDATLEFPEDRFEGDDAVSRELGEATFMVRISTGSGDANITVG